MKTIRILLLLCFAVASLPSLAQISEEFDYGNLQEHTYSNDFFGFSLDIPPDWFIQNEEQIGKLMDIGREMVTGDDENMKAILKASEVNTATLLAVYQYEMGSPVDYNPNLVMVAENLSLAPGVKSGKDYLFHARKLLLQTQMPYTHVDTTFGERDFGSQEFGVMHATLSLMGMEIGQTYYCTVKNGFSLSLIVSWLGEEQKEAIDKVLSSLTFE